jgi:hypothetical protein
MHTAYFIKAWWWTLERDEAVTVHNITTAEELIAPI